MTQTIGALLALSFLISVLGLFMFIWAQINGLMKIGSDASEVIFAKGEVQEWALVDDGGNLEITEIELKNVEEEEKKRLADTTEDNGQIST